MSTLPSQDHSENLRNTNLEGYRHLILSEASPILTLENILVRIRKLIRTQHLDINIPRAIIVSIMITGSVVLVNNKENDYVLVKDLAALIGAGTGIVFAMSNLHSKYHYNKRLRASEYIKEWRSEHMVALRKQSTKKIFKEVFFDTHPTHFNKEIFNKCHAVLAELKKTPDGVEVLEETQSKILERLENPDNENEKHDVEACLSFFEHMGQDVKCGVADSDYLKDYFHSIVISFYEFFRKYIEFVQYDDGGRLIYCNFVYMAQTWEKEGFLPELPKICNRPLVITSRDIEHACAAKAKKNQQGKISNPSITDD